MSKEMRDQLSKERASSFAAIARLQAKIDALMLEYCPQEMTPQQIKNYEHNQKAVPNV
ncbi:MAG: hypothetical protein WC648_04725 [Candidatus Paceibacterota bacterium]